MNCDLTNQNSSTLDPYNTQHLLVDAVTDFYDRLEHDEEEKDCLNIVEKKDIEEFFSDWYQRKSKNALKFSALKFSHKNLK